MRILKIIMIIVWTIALIIMATNHIYQIKSRIKDSILIERSIETNIELIELLEINNKLIEDLN